MTERYEQMELDTRSDFQRAIAELASDAVDEAHKLVKVSVESSSEAIMPNLVRNRYEAYGIAAEQMIRVNLATKMVKKDVDGLLETLTDPNRSAVEATSSIYNSATAAAGILIQAAAIIKRTMDNLYIEESALGSRPTPIEEYLDSQDFQEAEPVDAESADENEMEEE